MEIRQLRYFISVAELESFSRASASLNVAQPALSRQVRKLEEELGIPLFIRDGRGVRLSIAGERFYERVKEILHDLHTAKSEIQSLQKVPMGTAVLGVPQQLGASFIVSIVKAFRQTYPQATLRIIEGFSFQIEEWLESGRVDVGVVYNPKSSKKLFSKPMFMEDVYLVGPANWAKANDNCCDFSEIGNVPLIMPDRPSCLRDLIDEEAEKLGLDMDVVIEVDSIGAMKELVRDGQGFAIMPYSVLEQEVRRGELSALKIERPNIARQLVVALSPKSAASITTKVLMDLVLSESETFVNERRFRGIMHPLRAPALMKAS